MKSVIVLRKTLIAKPFAIEDEDFHDKKVPKVGSNYTCLVVILFDSALKKDKNYDAQVFLKECKYIEKEKKSDYTHY